MRAPEIAVVVASHDRPLRLRWLLNALEEQTLDPERWEIVVAHDSTEPNTDELLRELPLAEAGLLSAVRLPAGSARPGANRNAGWRKARAPVVAFTDDDCRPPPEWVARALDAARRHPGAIVQGTTRPDPYESNLLRAPHFHTQSITPPVPYGQACNIVYPRELLERLGGFDERQLTGEDTELAVRARESGAPYLAAPEVLTYHAVQPLWLPGMLRSLWRWQDLPYLVKRHPQLRRSFPLSLFWKPSHAWLPLLLAGAVLERRNPLFGLLAIPWLAHRFPQRGSDPRGRLRGFLELPAQVAIDLTELAALARGSLRHRTLFL